LTAAHSPPARRPGAAAYVAVTRLLLRHQVTAGRLVLLGALGTIAVLVAFAAGGRADDATETTARFLNGFGLGLVVPVGSLVLASSALGDLVDDATLVYLWLRPTPRRLVAAAAWTASLAVCLPLLVLPLTLAAALGSRGDPGVTLGVLAASALAVVAYTAVFTLLGLIMRRALLWGLVYVFIWEFFVARAGAGAARLSINSYPASVLADISGVPLRLADRAPTLGVAVPVVVGLLAMVLTSWRLSRAEVA
jgi:ABC-2 type transport system permease protein